jgi:hypothetical protein
MTNLQNFTAPIRLLRSILDLPPRAGVWTTGVDVTPIAMPMSAVLTAGASFTLSLVIACTGSAYHELLIQQSVHVLNVGSWRAP